jgi:hypothetical protein
MLIFTGYTGASEIGSSNGNGRFAFVDLYIYHIWLYRDDPTRLVRGGLHIHLEASTWRVVLRIETTEYRIIPYVSGFSLRA